MRLEEDDRVDGGAARLGIGAPATRSRTKLEIERPLQMAVEVIRRDEILQRDGRQREQRGGPSSPS